MSDDWNLKELYLEIESLAGKYGIECNTEVIEDIIEKHLLILRQKLIEVLEEYYISWFSKDYIIVGNKIKEIVNKKFEVKDNAKSKR